MTLQIPSLVTFSDKAIIQVWTRNKSPFVHAFIEATIVKLQKQG